MNPTIQFKTTILAVIIAVALGCFLGVPARAVSPGPPDVSSLFVPIEGDILEPGTTNVLHLSGEVHVITHVTFSDTGVPSVGIWVNLVRVSGTSSVTGITYLGVGANNVSWVGINPGPISIPEQQLTFALVSLGGDPGPPDTPPGPCLVSFCTIFVFGAENTNLGELQSVEASFLRN